MCSLVIGRADQRYQILVGEVKNAAKVTLLSFNRTDDFLCDVMVWKMACLK